MAMIPSKEAKEMLYSLLAENFVTLQVNLHRLLSSQTQSLCSSSSCLRCGRLYQQMGEPRFVSNRKYKLNLWAIRMCMVWISSVDCTVVISGDSQDPRLRSLTNVLPLLRQSTACGKIATGAMLQGDGDSLANYMYVASS